MSEHRRDARYPARIVARILRRNETIEFLTNDVSFRGVFIRTDSPPALRQLVKMELVLPSGLVVSGHAMVVHVTAPPADRPKGGGPIPGMGLQFWGSLMRVKEWEQFIHELKSRERSGTAAAKPTDKVRRISERFKLSLEVIFDGTTTMTRDASENGLAVRTDSRLPVGARTSVILRANDEELRFDAIVRRTIDEPDFRGLGIELVDLDPARVASLRGFLFDHTPGEEVIFVDLDDPKLH